MIYYISILDCRRINQIEKMKIIVAFTYNVCKNLNKKHINNAIELEKLILDENCVAF